MSDFPWRIHTSTELINEYNKLRNKLNQVTKITFPIPYSRIGYKCSNFFFQFERLQTPSYRKMSCFNYWKKMKDKIVENFHKGNKIKHGDLFSRITFTNYSPSQFPIMTAGQIYKYFNATKVLDPFAGWGDRCIAAMALDIDYTGIDSNTHLKPSYTEMINFYPSKSKIKMIYKKIENVNIDKFDFDFVFTSPPYWDNNNELIEKYHNTEINYHKFLKISLIPFVLKCINKNSNIWICLNIPPKMYNDIKDIIGPCKKPYISLLDLTKLIAVSIVNLKRTIYIVSKFFYLPNKN
jgi:DNA modification methylase